MYAKRTNDLYTISSRDRRKILMARCAVNDTYNGGVSALHLAVQLADWELAEIVDRIYSDSSGKVPDDLDAFECGECGQVYYGRNAAEICCSIEESED